MQKEVAKISNGLNVCQCYGEKRDKGGAAPDSICIVLSGGKSRSTTLPRKGGGGVWGWIVQFPVLPPHTHLFSDLSVNFITSFFPQLFQFGILCKYVLIHVLARYVLKTESHGKDGIANIPVCAST